MASKEQLALLRTSTQSWNQWRADNSGADVDLSKAYLFHVFLPEVNLDSADLSGADLSSANLAGASLRAAILTGADLSWAKLSAADLSEATLTEANLMEANLSRANLSRSRLCEANLSAANLPGADLSEADLRGADLRGADLRGADLSGADLSGADLCYSICVGGNFSRTTLTGCRIYALSSWDATTETAIQKSLCITLRDEPEITVDDLSVAQFVASFLAGDILPSVFSPGTSRLALIVGRFAGERKALLEALSDDLRRRRYLPIYQEVDTSSTGPDQSAVFSRLAHLSQLVLADLTGARGLWQTLARSIPELPWVVCQPLIQADEAAPMEERRTVSWLLPLYRYRDLESLLSGARAAPGEETRKLRAVHLTAPGDHGIEGEP